MKKHKNEQNRQNGEKRNKFAKRSQATDAISIKINVSATQYVAVGVEKKMQTISS